LLKKRWKWAEVQEGRFQTRRDAGPKEDGTILREEET
jgi:hypothetical protein